MAAKTPRFGVGPALALATLAWAGGAYTAHIAARPIFATGGTVRYVLAAVGGGLVAAGLPVYAWSLRVFRRAWKRGELATTGPYAHVRHPIYATWIFLIVPGVCLLVGSWVMLSTPVAMYAAARLFVGREERAMEARFGKAWRAWRDRTGMLFPRLIRHP